MKSIKCNNSNSKAVTFFPNGGRADQIMVFATEDGEYWFSIGKFYKSEKSAKRAAVKTMLKYEYTFDAQEMESLTIV